VVDLKRELQTLSQFYIETRYPADSPEFTAAEAREAFAMAQKVKQYVNSKISAN
jgi:HEPN domain-containing protein